MAVINLSTIGKVGFDSKRVLEIIFPSTQKYTEALSLARLEILAARRIYLCEKHMNKMRCTNHSLNALLPKQLDKCCEYELRDKTRRDSSKHEQNATHSLFY